MTMPNFLIIGAQKAGTTALYHYLKQHPQIYMSPVKEPNFFTYEGEKLDLQNEDEKLDFQRQDRSLAGQVTNIDDYRALFQDVSNETAIGEASPSYLSSTRVPECIRHYIPNAKLIAILRHPAERAYSNFLHRIRRGREPHTDFAQALQAQDARIPNNRDSSWCYKPQGFYYAHLKRYFDIFDWDQIKVYLYEDLNTRSIDTLQHIFRFLGVDETFVPDVSIRHHVSGIPRNEVLQTIMTRLNPLYPILKQFLPVGLYQSIRNYVLLKPPKFPPEVRQQLLEVYREDILKLQDLLQRDLSKWLE